jgi:hypothetical protein
MIIKGFAVAVAALVLIAPAFADDAAMPDTGEGRYTLNKVTDGFVRLDTQTGEVSLCSKRSVGWACAAVPEDRALFENEIARLRAENGALKKDLLARGLPLPAGATPEPPAVRDGDRTLRLPGDADIDRVVHFMGRVWHRLVDAITRAQKEVLNKS